MKVARKPKSVGHFFGCLAVAAFPSALSIKAYARSPSRPRSVTSAAVSSSPCIDLTGYRQSEATESCVALGMSVSLLTTWVSMLHKPSGHHLMLQSPPSGPLAAPAATGYVMISRLAFTCRPARTVLSLLPASYEMVSTSSQPD